MRVSGKQTRQAWREMRANCVQQSKLEKQPRASVVVLLEGSRSRLNERSNAGVWEALLEGNGGELSEAGEAA